jgi:rhodanese-related sulfurtransferase
MAIQQTTPAEAQRLIGQGYRYIDVRTEQEFVNGHPATAVNIPVAVPDPATGQMAMNPDFLPVIEAHFPKDAPIVVGCQSGMRSQRAAELLAHAGYTSVTNMQGGFGGARDQTGRTVIPGWSESGLPVCKDCGPENSYAGLRGKVG